MAGPPSSSTAGVAYVCPPVGLVMGPSYATRWARVRPGSQPDPGGRNVKLPGALHPAKVELILSTPADPPPGADRLAAGPATAGWPATPTPSTCASTPPSAPC